jgi:hypothetical protein
MPFMRMKTLYRREGDGKVSPLYVDLLPKHLTLDSKFVAKRHYVGRKTLFKEVSLLPMDDAVTPVMRTLFNTRCGFVNDNTQDLLTAVADRFLQVVEENWDPKASHAILNSSGLDSRIMSWTLKMLREKHGDEWIGNTMFLCSKWEGLTFEEIMHYEEWSEDQFCVVRKDARPKHYYDHSLLDFENAWKRADGVSAIPVNLFWYPVKYALRFGLLDKSKRLQTWSTMWGNELLNAVSGPNGGRGVRRVFRNLYKCVMCYRPVLGDSVVQPFTDIQLLRTVMKSSTRLGLELRPRLVEHLDNKLLHGFDNIDADADRGREIALDTISQVLGSYSKSWYGKNVRPGVKPLVRTTEFQSFWSHWTAASLCDHLLREGYSIEIE